MRDLDNMLVKIGKVIYHFEQSSKTIPQEMIDLCTPLWIYADFSSSLWIHSALEVRFYNGLLTKTPHIQVRLAEELSLGQLSTRGRIGNVRPVEVMENLLHFISKNDTKILSEMSPPSSKRLITHPKIWLHVCEENTLHRCYRKGSYGFLLTYNMAAAGYAEREENWLSDSQSRHAENGWLPLSSRQTCQDAFFEVYITRLLKKVNKPYLFICVHTRIHVLVCILTSIAFSTAIRWVVYLFTRCFPIKGEPTTAWMLSI